MILLSAKWSIHFYAHTRTQTNTHKFSSHCRNTVPSKCVTQKCYVLKVTLSSNISWYQKTCGPRLTPRLSSKFIQLQGWELAGVRIISLQLSTGTTWGSSWTSVQLGQILLMTSNVWPNISQLCLKYKELQQNLGCPFLFFIVFFEDTLWVIKERDIGNEYGTTVTVWSYATTEKKYFQRGQTFSRYSATKLKLRRPSLVSWILENLATGSRASSISTPEGSTNDHPFFKQCTLAAQLHWAWWAKKQKEVGAAPRRQNLTPPTSHWTLQGWFLVGPFDNIESTSPCLSCSYITPQADISHSRNFCCRGLPISNVTFFHMSLVTSYHCCHVSQRNWPRWRENP